MMGNNTPFLFVGSTIFLIFLFTRCSPPNFYEKTVDIENLWKKEKPASFSFKIEDNKPKKITLLLRNNNSYEFSNIYFFIHQTNPDGKKEIDTLQYFLAKPTGEWIGTGITEIKQNLLEIKEIKNNKKGTYKIDVYQAMRKDTLKGIEDITLIIN